jgi:hypothetical protein
MKTTSATKLAAALATVPPETSKYAEQNPRQ